MRDSLSSSSHSFPWPQISALRPLFYMHMDTKRNDHGNRFAYAFYISPEWIKCRQAYAKSKGLLCERCFSRGLVTPGEQVHHKIKLTPANIHDPSVSLNWDNLELLCRRCHQEEHSGRRWRCDEFGHVDLGGDT